LNISNHPNFAASLNTVITAGGYATSASQITKTAATWRQIHFGSKLSFQRRKAKNAEENAIGQCVASSLPLRIVVLFHKSIGSAG
jgi:hypothetical protein